MSALGTPHLHLRVTASTSDRARGLAQAGAPHGTLVTAGAQSAVSRGDAIKQLDLVRARDRVAKLRQEGMLRLKG